MADAKALVLAEKIEQKAHDTLAVLDREMTVMKWPPEFRAIMYRAIAQTATLRAMEQELEQALAP